ncbi:MAG: hypothetical protein ACSW8C_04315 [bacterium]
MQHNTIMLKTNKRPSYVAGVISALAMTVNSMLGISEEYIPAFMGYARDLYKKTKEMEEAVMRGYLSEAELKISSNKYEVRFRYILSTLGYAPEYISEIPYETLQNIFRPLVYEAEGQKLDEKAKEAVEKASKEALLKLKDPILLDVGKSSVIVSVEPKTITEKKGTCNPEDLMGDYVRSLFRCRVSDAYRGNVLAYKNIFDQTIFLRSGWFSSSGSDADGIYVPFEDIVGLACNCEDLQRHNYTLSLSENFIQQTVRSTTKDIDTKQAAEFCRICFEKNTDVFKRKYPHTRIFPEKRYVGGGCYYNTVNVGVYNHTELQIQGLIAALNQELGKDKGTRDENRIKTIICLLPKLLVVELEGDHLTNSDIINRKTNGERTSFKEIRTTSQEEEQDVFQLISTRFAKKASASHHNHHSHVRKHSNFDKTEIRPSKRRRISEAVDVSVGPEKKIRTVFSNFELASSFCIFSLFEACMGCRLTGWLSQKSGSIHNKLFFRFVLLDNSATENNGIYKHEDRRRGTNVFLNQLALEEGHIFLEDKDHS